MVLELATLIDPDLASWIANNGAFPATMVDRIVPATKPEDIAALAKLTGKNDAAPVMHEPFRQWVIEDKFVNNDRPDYAATGAQLVSDVGPFEHMKLRCLNGTHSALAYLGYLSGYKTIYDAVSEPVFAAFCKYMWRQEITPVLKAPQGIRLEDYTHDLFNRYSNPAIRHLTYQIAMDGSQKLPQRILTTISENLDAGRDCAGLVLVVAAWMLYVGGVDENGSTFVVQDPLAERLKTLAGKPSAMLAMTEVFPADLAASPTFRNAVLTAYDRLGRLGSLACVKEIIQ